MSSLDDLIIGEKIKNALNARKKVYTTRILKASDKDSLNIKLQEEAKEGWEFLRTIKVKSRGKKSCNIQKPIALKVQLEDELWCIAAGMGFKQLSDGHNFVIPDETKPRQIDIFAKDDETALFIECTQAEEQGKKSMEKVINKITQMRKGVFENVKKHFSKEGKLKQKWVIATRRIDWNQNDLDKAREENIHVIQDGEIDYYRKLIKHIKGAARYQFLAHLFFGEQIPGLKLSVPATKGKMGRREFYNFLMKPSDLLKIAYIAHREKPEENDLESYQRMVRPGRLKAIANYINKGDGGFPTNIVINIHSKRPLKFDQKEKFDNGVVFGTLGLPECYAAAWIIDGQHRLYGYEFSRHKEDATIPVLAFLNLPPEDEANLFIDINCQQVKVKKSLFQDIAADLHWNSPDPKQKLKALEARAVKKLNSTENSPLHNRIVPEGGKKTNTRCITMLSITEVLSETKLLGEVHGDKLEAGYLSTSDTSNIDENLKRGVSILSYYLNCYKESSLENWEIGDATGIGYLCTNSAIRAQFKILKEICKYYEYKTGILLRTHNPEEFIDSIKDYIEPVATFFQNASTEELQALRQHSAQKGVTIQANSLMAEIHKKYKDFQPQGLKEFVEAEDGEFHKKARECCDTIERTLLKFVVEKLKEKFPVSKQWWKKGVLQKIRLEVSGRKEKDDQDLSIECYFSLPDLTSIISDNWNDIFVDHFKVKGASSKKKHLEWTGKLRAIRNKCAHVSQGAVSKKELEYVLQLEKDIKSKTIEMN